MINHCWAAKGTLVIEMMPTTRPAMLIFEEASVLSQAYAAILVEPTDQWNGYGDRRANIIGAALGRGRRGSVAEKLPLAGQGARSLNELL
ncbi:hypothetical protein C8R43DRAFT_1003212 [Mycena crocata]|nr:hypothetical protein C8R43DRAFT_1003212 [Mycena crocata]